MFNFTWQWYGKHITVSSCSVTSCFLISLEWRQQRRLPEVAAIVEFKYVKYVNVTWSSIGSGSRISQRGCQPLRVGPQPTIWPVFPKKLHKNEEILVRGRGSRQWGCQHTTSPRNPHAIENLLYVGEQTPGSENVRKIYNSNSKRYNNM